MKALFLLSCLVIFAATEVPAQFFNSSHVPIGSKLAMQQLYPEITDIRWTKEREGYEAVFLLHHKPHFVLFDLNGDYIAEVSVLKRQSLPRRIRKHLHEAYRSFRLEDALMLTTSTGEVRYETQIINNQEEFKLLFNGEGYVIEVQPVVATLTE